MDELDYNPSFEDERVIEYVSKSFNYSSELSRVLLRVLPAMLDGVDYEHRQIFYDMLKHTPILVVNDTSKITLNDIMTNYMLNTNTNIVKEPKEKQSEYDRRERKSAFISEPVFDENLQIQGVKQFIFVTRIDEDDLGSLDIGKMERMQKFDTTIDVISLINELGHAWVSEVDAFEMENGVLTQRFGCAEVKDKFTKNLDGKFTRQRISEEGLLLEEAINSNMEDIAVAKYLKITPEKLNEYYKKSYAFRPSVYRGLISGITSYLTNNLFKNEVMKWRVNGDIEAAAEINEVLEKTKQYTKRSEDNEDSRKKKIVFTTPIDDKMKEVFDRCHDDFFAEKEEMTPLQYLDNILVQCYDIVSNRLSFSILTEDSKQKYTDMIDTVVSDGYIMINQAIEVSKSLAEEKKETEIVPEQEEVEEPVVEEKKDKKSEAKKASKIDQEFDDFDVL